MAYDPCSCIGRVTPSTPVTDSCLRLGHIVVADCDTVDPCGGTGTVLFDCFDYDCDTPPTFTVYSNSRPDLVTVTDISDAGIEFTTTEDSVGGERIEIVFFAACGTGCQQSSSYGTVVFYIKNLCKGVACGTGYTCNPCTGLCIPTDPEIQVSDSPEIIIT